MTPCARKLALPLSCLLTLGLPGCASLTSEIKVPANVAEVAKEIGHIRTSRHDTCETRQQVARQSSTIDTLITGKVVAYKVDCTTKPTGQPKPPSV